MDTSKYGRIPSVENASESDLSLDKESLLRHPEDANLERKRPYKSYAIWFLNGLLFVASLVLFGLSTRKQQCNTVQCLETTEAFSPLFPAVEFEMVKFQGYFTAENKYKGAPSPELDKAWEELQDLDPFPLTAEEMKKINQSLDRPMYPDEVGGGYLGRVEVFHQIHCLELVRQYTYRDYYEKQDPPPLAFTDKPSTVRKHVDHCIDIIRQVLMCHGDVGIYTTAWVEKYKDPYPDFNSWHKCRKNGPLLDFMKERKVMYDVRVPEGAHVLKQPPT